ncbi:MAG: hypothetical protein P0Y49_07890 [Candidatus Pedobacter colombiensis]|uniref:Tetratricopeptide repeat protein n=1 Tax=Candidatus Pedobacter colombiensis TaxID=3121371 RepID=A0AAJ5WCQ4_9SPHI|nr:hypothetical protein [Pedobacter sp.]WEK21059.1 MAG: hypothetical protein P0Y49_07890 [Pedobacter sp.]
MTKFYIAFLFCISICFPSFANIDYINISKISTDATHIKYYSFIKDNKRFYDRWAVEWKYDQPKAILIAALKEAYTSFASIPKQNTELQLLLGDISHYLYNMDVSESFDLAVKNYDLAIKSSPNDVRGHWFLGYHYGLSNGAVKAIDQFILAQKCSLGNYAGPFWNDYAYVSMIAGMPSTVLFAMKKAKLALGKPGAFENEFGQAALQRFTDVDADQEYKNTEIWEASKGEMVTFISRPLGVKILLDSTWIINVVDFKNRQNVFIMTPPKIKNKEGKDIGYTLLMMMKVARDGEELSGYLDNLVVKYPMRQKISFSNKYDKMIAYEIKDKSMYPHLGGGHTYTLGIERNNPEDPGLLLEQPTILQTKGNGQLTYFKANQSKNRFAGKIFYTFLLDSCEDIHEQSLVTFKSFIEKQLFIE